MIVLQTHMQTDTQTDRQTDRQADRQTDTQTHSDRKITRQTDMQADCKAPTAPTQFHQTSKHSASAKSQTESVRRRHRNIEQDRAQDKTGKYSIFGDGTHVPTGH